MSDTTGVSSSSGQSRRRRSISKECEKYSSSSSRFFIFSDSSERIGFVLFISVLFSFFLIPRDFTGSWQAIIEPQESSLSRFLTLSFEDSAEKFFTYTKLGLPKPLRFRSIKPNSSSSRSSLVALLSAQRKVLLTSSIVKMMNTRPFLSNHSFLTERLMRSSKMPYRVLASVDRFWNRCSWKRAFGMRKNEKSSPACP